MTETPKHVAWFDKPDFPIEGSPTTDQKDRLEDWLSQIKIVCRTYGILLDTDDGETRLIDLETGKIIGMGLTYLMVQRRGHTRISAYDVTDSILDGTWPVDTPAGTADQRQAGHVWPQRPTSERP